MPTCLTRLSNWPGSWKHLPSARFLASLVTREIISRLLIGGQGTRLSHILASGADTHFEGDWSPARAFDEQLKVEEIAREPGMSVSGFHHHFTSVTR